VDRSISDGPDRHPVTQKSETERCAKKGHTHCQTAKKGHCIVTIEPTRIIRNWTEDDWCEWSIVYIINGCTQIEGNKSCARAAIKSKAVSVE